MKLNNILETIGNTPHIRINRLFPESHEVWMKLERANPGGSIKDRIALAMIEDAEARGVLKPDSVIVEPTSGNTGIGLAMAAAVKGYKVILIMPDSIAVERMRLMEAYGAICELTPRAEGVKGTIARAEAIRNETPNAWMPDQYNNPANIEIHKRTTAQEILRDFPECLDYLISGVGTGGHISGAGEVLKENWPRLQVFAVEPDASPVISGGAPGLHPIQEIGVGFIPTNLHINVLDGAIAVSGEEAYEMTQRAAKEEGIFLGLSAGASLAAIRKKLPEIPTGSRILTFGCDMGERYLSVEGLF